MSQKTQQARSSVSSVSTQGILQGIETIDPNSNQEFFQMLGQISQTLSKYEMKKPDKFHKELRESIKKAKQKTLELWEAYLLSLRQTRQQWKQSDQSLEKSWVKFWDSIQESILKRRAKLEKSKIYAERASEKRKAKGLQMKREYQQRGFLQQNGKLVFPQGRQQQLKTMLVRLPEKDLRIVYPFLSDGVRKEIRKHKKMSEMAQGGSKGNF